MLCNLCPKNCNIDRAVSAGGCKCGETIKIARIGLHFWEEPCISGGRGSGAVFFSGCNLNCRFCQNGIISATGDGVDISVKQLSSSFLYLQDKGAANINLVTPSHYSDKIAEALSNVKSSLEIPVIYNTNAYEKVQAVKNLSGLVDVYLPDLKFYDKNLSKNLCGAEDYFAVASQAVCEMFKQKPINVYGGDGYVQKGVVVRHLIIPGHTEDSKRVLDFLSEVNSDATVSLMAQYFPARKDDTYSELNRRLYKREYGSVKQYFFNVGLANGYCQSVESATEDYVPEFLNRGELRALIDKIGAQ